MVRRIHLAALIGCFGLLFAFSAHAVDKSVVKSKWHTPYDLYLSAQEAFDMKNKQGKKLLFIDVRTRAEVKYIGMADSVDVNIPIRTLDTRYNWSERSNTFKTKSNALFVKAVRHALEQRGLDDEAPIILICQSGSRSPIAAKALHKAGFGTVYTLHEGFEGAKAKSGQRKGQRVVNGWKNAGLPWSYKLSKEKMYFPAQVK